ncbi:MAG: MBL fold metallo-hydrolase [Massilibacteroides sp.]|nr:MBL fold metallo-hydrolase [Massilibacteroides sp.]MDD3061474.1 MBL fold metallo-hydrolase [Massilibacteroides sp.]MDD4114545.1 MBL fold metallo-hydrolase [Massilibacteroides sp.]MDD4659236.1 MBL fold metallo-hydrolase [Massilibacteroides sp.]
MITIKPFEFNYFSENCYLLHDETKEAVLIDCGACRKEEEDELIRYIEENDLTLKRLLCTHLHLDHIFGNDFIYKKYGLKPEAHRTDVEKLPSPAEQARLFGLKTAMQPIKVAHYIVGNEIITFGDSELIALLVPGHSPGSLAFYNKKERFVISGDALFCGSIGRTDLWGGDQDVLIAAINDKLFSLPDETVVYPGHGPTTSIIEEKFNNPYL